MASSITSAGLVFPDATVQTTAASASGGTTEAIASGSLSNGSTVVVNADGTVSVVSGVIEGAGTPVVFEAANTANISATYDSTNNKVVISYKDNGNSGYPTSIVGTVSGSSISFGTAVVFRSNSITGPISSTYDAASGKIVIAYRDEANLGGSIVGTVSGTSISFGSAVLFNSGNSDNVSITYHSVAQKVVIAYRNNANSRYGTAIVGTVSGTNISYGSATVFASSSTDQTSLSYDSANQKIIITYVNGGNLYGTTAVGTVSGTNISFGTPVVFRSASTANISSCFDTSASKTIITYRAIASGTAIVGTVSGTSISFGTPVVFDSSYTTEISSTYDSSAAKIITAYRDGGNSDYGTVIVGTVSGTSISFGTPMIFESAATNGCSAIYNVTNQATVIAYVDEGNTSYGTSSIFRLGSTNLTSENFIGISSAAYTNGQTATIQIAGAVDDAQSGLTAGQSYFVQTNGTLGLTPASPSVFAGTAISATKIVVQG